MRYYNFSRPKPADIVTGSRKTTGTLFTVPAGQTWKGFLNLNASSTSAGTDGGSVSVSGTNAIPQGAVLQLALAATGTTATASSISVQEVFIYGGDAGATVTFTAPASGVGAAQGVGVIIQ